MYETHCLKTWRLVGCSQHFTNSIEKIFTKIVTFTCDFNCSLLTQSELRVINIITRRNVCVTRNSEKKSAFFACMGILLLRMRDRCDENDGEINEHTSFQER